ncbi:MAG: DMT family transporter [Micrococcales bacterium]|nr:DMT family transporter [Micrococcales bacterium]
MVAVLGFVSAVLFGASDFFGGLAAKRAPAIAVAGSANVVAAAVVAVAVAATGPIWSSSAVLWGIVAGVGGAIGTAGLYAVLAIGPMSVLSPTVAALYALLPAAVGIALGERLAPLGYAALVVVFVAGMLLAVTRETGGARVRPRVLALAVVAGVGFAGYIIAIDRAPDASGLIPLLVELVVGALLFVPLVLAREMRSPGSVTGALRTQSVLMQILGCGVLMAVGTILLVLGLQLGDLAVMSVLNSLYPLGTVALAMIVLRERLTAVQGIGIVLALAGSITIGLSA